jgi:hypothetical protein
VPETKFSDLLHDDPFVGALTRLLIVAVTLLIFSWSAFLAGSALNALVMPDLFPIVVTMIDGFLPLLGGLGGDYVSTLIGAIPIALAGLCYATVRTKRRLNGWGQTIAILSLLSAAASFFALTALKAYPEKMLVLGTETLITTLQDSSELALRTSVFYIALLFGLGSKHENP